MARSFRRTPIHGHCGTTDKFGKVHSHRATRLRVRVHLVETLDDSIVLPLARELKSTWDFAKDGKGYLLHDDVRVRPYKVRARRNEKRLVLITLDADSDVIELVRK
jgi:hypothetical protein